MPPQKKQPLSRQIIAWCLYDWANSAFALTVMAGFFPVFFKTYWNSGVDPVVSTVRLGYGNSIAGLCIALCAPLLGALADAGRAKKKLLIFFALTGASLSGVLSLIGQGSWFTALLIYMAALICFTSANLFYDSLLSDVAEPQQFDFVSSLGFGLGYLGCGLLFLFNVVLISHPQWLSDGSKTTAVQQSFISVFIWWIIFSLPLFFFVRERATIVSRPLLHTVKQALCQLVETFKAIRSNRRILFFLLAYWLYIDGLNTFIVMAGDFGLSIGLTTESLLRALLVVQFVAFPSSIIFGLLAKRFGAQKMILVGLIIYSVVCAGGTLLIKNALHYTILAALVGSAQGGVQALSRSFFARLIPLGRAAEYFGFYNLVGKSAVILGPALVATVTLLLKNGGYSHTMAVRFGMSTLTVLFVAGAIFLLSADHSTNHRQNKPL